MTGGAAVAIVVAASSHIPWAKATALAAADGARMFRVHEVGPTRRVLEMVASIQGVRPPTRTVRGLA